MTRKIKKKKLKIILIIKLIIYIFLIIGFFEFYNYFLNSKNYEYLSKLEKESKKINPNNKEEKIKSDLKLFSYNLLSLFDKNDRGEITEVEKYVYKDIRKDFIKTINNTYYSRFNQIRQKYKNNSIVIEDIKIENLLNIGPFYDQNVQKQFPKAYKANIIITYKNNKAYKEYQPDQNLVVTVIFDELANDYRIITLE